MKLTFLENRMSLKTVPVHIFCGVDVMNCETCYEYRIMCSGTPGQSNLSFYQQILKHAQHVGMRIQEPQVGTTLVFFQNKYEL